MTFLVTIVCIGCCKSVQHYFSSFYIHKQDFPFPGSSSPTLSRSPLKRKTINDDVHLLLLKRRSSSPTLSR
ncbi:hypothetical protein L1987_09939 [Smallanthus sonchifolius]|uniref:Uncharacterized protein n=1 Tax=Smallanthus sonchifolius TaxID=185202 RepID=A0ACB9JQQ7_9ASTR|nr:hypothetical protein L1987_09939 [Smallanthus sonchifolius]